MRQVLLSLRSLRTRHILLGMAGGVLLLLLLSPFMVALKVDQTVTVGPERTRIVGPFIIPAQLVGASRIEVEAKLGDQRWATYEVQLLDQNDQVLLAGMKNAWRESGTWSEDGESGTWEQRDQNAGFELQLPQQQPMKLAISLVEVSDNRGRPVKEVVDFQVKVREGTIEILPLCFSLAGLLGLAMFQWWYAS